MNERTILELCDARGRDLLTEFISFRARCLEGIVATDDMNDARVTLPVFMQWVCTRFAEIEVWEDLEEETGDSEGCFLV